MTGPAVTHLDPWSSDDATPPDGVAWDLVVLGAGTAGIVAARTAAGFGATVLVVEARRPGGDCLWTGCVPSKSLLAAAHTAADARRGARLGVHCTHVRVDFAAVMARVRAAVTAIEPDDSPATIRTTGARIVHGSARFAGADRVLVRRSDSRPDGGGGDDRVRFRHAVIATGSAPDVPAIPGLADAQPLTSETVWTLETLPARLLVLGGGGVGCELGQAFARLGSHVTLVESGARLLAGEDPDAAEAVAAALDEDGVSVLTGTALDAVERADGGFVARLPGGRSVAFDAVLVAAGRTADTADLGLDAAGVVVDEHGHVRTDERLRTSNRRVFAAGDVTARSHFTHMAGVHGSLAATNAVLGLRRRVDAVVPRVTFTQPEVAAFGIAPHDAEKHGGTVRTIEHTDVDRAVTDDRPRGATRLVLDHRGRLVGASVVGPRAGESLAELVLAATQGMRARSIASATHAYPTYGDGAWNASIAELQAQLGAPLTRAVTTGLLRLQRRRSG